MPPLQEKYFELLPLLDRASVVSIGEGYTPFFRAKRLGNELGMSGLWLKDETGNPTGSFKDRPIVLGLAKALELGAETVATASSGNAANSLAAGSAKRGVRCVAFVPEKVPESKAYLLQHLGATVVRVAAGKDRSVDPTAWLLREACDRFGWHPVPSFGAFNPYQIEGAKTLAYEICEAGDVDHVVVQVGGAGLLAGVYRGFRDYLELGFIDQMPMIHAVQSEGCAPFVKAFQEGRDVVAWDSPSTVAGGIADNYTWDWREGFEALRETGGSAVAVTDAEILDARRLLGKLEGVFAEPTGSASLAGVMALQREGMLGQGERVCALVTGSGYKDLGPMAGEYRAPPLISSSLAELERLLPKT